MSNDPQPNIPTTPLCVDLDGTLIRSDLFVESLLRYLTSGPWRIFSVISWLLSSRARLKRELANRIEVNVEALPYNSELLTFLRDEKQSGRQIVLVSGSDDLYVQNISNHLGIFTSAKGSDGKTNLIGSSKAKFLTQSFGEKGFDYVGNAKVDIKVWKHAAGAYVVSHGSNLQKAATSVTQFRKRFVTSALSIKTIARVLRVHQWSKNALIFVPLVGAHRFTDLPLLLASIKAAIAFSFAASCVYITNDILDIESDRKHPKKKFRPLAGGKVSINHMIVIGCTALILAVLFAVQLPWKFQVALVFYAFTTAAYSAWVKRWPIADIVLLSMFYLLRVLGGSFATGIVVSQWLQLLCLFFFTSLAALKRFCELRTISKESPGRGYGYEDLNVVQQFGVSSGLLSVLVLALYTNSKEVQSIYQSPQFIWLVCPLLLYWIGRVWVLAARGKVDYDPLVFALRDLPSYLLLAAAAALMLFAAKFTL